MGKIEDVLTADEHVTKKQGSVQLVVGERGMPTGDLYLTERRLIFLVGKGRSVLTPGAGIGAKDLILSLQDIKSVNKGALGYLKISADKEYQFAVSVWNSGGWVDAIKQAIALYPPAATAEPMPPAGQPMGRRREPAQPSASRFCHNCGSPVRPEARFCEKCGTRLE